MQRLIRRNEGYVARAGEGDETLEVVLLSPVEVALDLDETARLAEDRHEPLERRARGVAIARRDRCRERSARATGETDEPGGMRFEVVPARRRRAFRSAQLHLRDQTAEVLIALAVLDEERQTRAAGERDLGAHERLDPRVDRGAVQPRRPVD